MSLLLKARELGLALTETQEYVEMRAAESAVEADREASALIEEWNRVRSGFVDAMAQRGGNAEEIAEQLRAFKDIMNMNPHIAEMEESRARFTAVLGQVNDILRYVVTGEEGEPAEEDSCDSCAHCGGGGCYLH